MSVGAKAPDAAAVEQAKAALKVERPKYMRRRSMEDIMVGSVSNMKALWESRGGAAKR